MTDQQTTDRLIEQALKKRWGGAYDCDDPMDDCQDVVDDDRRILRRAVERETRGLIERMADHADGDDDLRAELVDVATALASAADAILAADEVETVECPDPEHHEKDRREGHEICCFCGARLSQGDEG